jgi:hypothetical protein
MDYSRYVSKTIKEFEKERGLKVPRHIRQELFNIDWGARKEIILKLAMDSDYSDLYKMCVYEVANNVLTHQYITRADMIKYIYMKCSAILFVDIIVAMKFPGIMKG